MTSHPLSDTSRPPLSQRAEFSQLFLQLYYCYQWTEVGISWRFFTSDIRVMWCRVTMINYWQFHAIIRYDDTSHFSLHSRQLLNFSTFTSKLCLLCLRIFSIQGKEHGHTYISPHLSLSQADIAHVKWLCLLFKTIQHCYRTLKTVCTGNTLLLLSPISHS